MIAVWVQSSHLKSLTPSLPCSLTTLPSCLVAKGQHLPTYRFLYKFEENVFCIFCEFFIRVGVSEKLFTRKLLNTVIYVGVCP